VALDANRIDPCNKVNQLRLLCFAISIGEQRQQ
jgi:hypothetical protein